MNFYKCHVCWNGSESCKCTEEEIRKYEKNLIESKEKFRENERKEYHQLLDTSFAKYSELFFVQDNSNFAVYFSKQILKNLNRGQWLSLRNQFDKFFQTENEKPN